MLAWCIRRLGACHLRHQSEGGRHLSLGVAQKSGGSEMGVRGEYREIVPPERIVNTELFDEPWYPGEALLTTTLVEQENRTTLTLAILYESQEACDGVLKFPMKRGVTASYNKLAELLESIFLQEAQ